MKKMRQLIVIPARLSSWRFPNKPLTDLLSMPMFEHVYKRSELVSNIDDIVLAVCDEELFEKCIKHLEADGFINSSEVKDFFTLRVKCAYPFVRLNYRKKLEEVFNYFEKIPGISLAGRTGGFEYKDIDQCMEETANLIKQLKVGGTI